MRILVHEFVSGGGLAGKPVPPSLAREGRAMRDALVADLVASGGHEVVVTTDSRFPLATRQGAIQARLSTSAPSALSRLIDSADAVWLIAPESDRCLEKLARRVERRGKPLLGPSAAVIRAVTDKAILPRWLSRAKVSHPVTETCSTSAGCRKLARELGYPLVLKPARGAGCVGVCLVRSERDLERGISSVRRAQARGPIVVQQYVRGLAASVSLLADGRRAHGLTLNVQRVRPASEFTYHGGQTPLRHPLERRAVAAARRTCEIFPGLRGYVGVDLVLTESEVFVIEVNPRLTTAYLGVRAVADENVAVLALKACAGRLPRMRFMQRRGVRFSADGGVAS